MPESSLIPAICEVEKVIRKHHLSYEQFSYVTKSARQRTQLKAQVNPLRKIIRLTQMEQKCLIQTAYSMKGNTGLLVKTLLLTGTRVSEFVEITIDDFVDDAQTIIINNAKGGKQRVVPITEALTQELHTYIGSRERGFLFESRNHQKYSTRRIQQIVKKTALNAGINKRVHPHLLRHTVATFLLEQGMPLDQIQMFLGHSRIENTQIYAKNSAYQIKENYHQAMKHF